MGSIDRVFKEIRTAREKYNSFNSTHEVYGVLKEGVDEFWDLVKVKPGPMLGEDYERMNAMKRELTQVAAIALRAIDEIEKGEIKFV